MGMRNMQLENVQVEVEKIMPAITLYFPSKDKYGKTIRAKQRNDLLTYAIERMTHTFGGTTTTEGIGTYKNGDGIMAEKVTVITSFTNNFDDGLKNIMESLAATIKANLDQGDVMYSVTEGYIKGIDA